MLRIGLSTIRSSSPSSFMAKVVFQKLANASQVQAAEAIMHNAGEEHIRKAILQKEKESKKDTRHLNTKSACILDNNTLVELKRKRDEKDEEEIRKKQKRQEEKERRVNEYKIRESEKEKEKQQKEIEKQRKIEEKLRIQLERGAQRERQKEIKVMEKNKRELEKQMKRQRV
ncbi:uncharacterized protein LAJ45_11740 [Morchella importuna]|uniref:uncharacterized protein n=1 Tax=Morchella importuna TaxID=1174673 RepID=UPI001E8D610A|nr:uncharacterized protein LAJ45_11740 [Morchella importuna]KAH8144292.1 hypothetical protein LAJ45_11740 [Morchella importuna]